MLLISLLYIFSNLWLDLFIFTLLLLTIIYYCCYYTFDKWEKLNIPYVRPTPFFGNYFFVAMGIDNIAEMYKKIYYELAGHKYGGLYQMRTPYLMIRDPELINNILIKDFSYFPNRGVSTDYSSSPMTDSLFWNENPQWKTMRNKLSPAFTSGKIKQTYDTIKECSDKMMMNILKEYGTSNDIDILDITKQFAINVIGTCFFGLKMNEEEESYSKFHMFGKVLFKPSPRFHLRDVCKMISPNLLKFVRLDNFPKKATEFFRSMFYQTLMYREKNNIIRNDFVDCLIKARKDLVLNTNLSEKEKFTDIQIVANAFAMFAAGFETVSTTISYCLQELALKKHIQDKLRAEIKLNISKNNGIIDNDFLLSLHYLDMVMSETVRKYPASFAVFRKSAHTYHVPNDSLIIEKNQKIVIPINSLHNDPRYFNDPEVFDPERFSFENKVKIPNGVYLPFGGGPRICIARRFAKLEIKLALVNILSQFEVEPCEKTEIPIIFTCRSMLTGPKSGKIWLKFNRISD